MSHERVRAEMEYFAEHRVSSFWLCDANFGILKDDGEIAEMMCEINSAHNYPFKHVGVNWAKNSSDKVLELAETFRRGRMACTTTLALQSVTAEAEERSQRYSMPSSRFTGLIRTATERNLDTYTDLIWGLPGESFDEFMEGVDAVVSTGVPSILIHQLYLLPGTAFYEERQQLGLEMLDSPPPNLSHLDTGGIRWGRSDYWDYTITRHPKMTRDDQIRGARMQGINHLLHNHMLGVVPGFFLARYGVSHREVYEFFDEMLTGDLPVLQLESTDLLDRFRAVILGFSDNIGLDEYLFYRAISELTWFRQTTKGERVRADDKLRDLIHAFYGTVSARLRICESGWEAKLLREMIDYGLLLAPKPGWQSKALHEFSFDVAGIWSDIYEQVVAKPADVDGDGTVRARTRARPGEWQQVARETRERVAATLTDEYLLGKRQRVSFKAQNPWVVAPTKDNCDWLLSSRSKRIQMQAVAP